MSRRADFPWPHSFIPINPQSVLKGVENFERFLDKSQLEQRNFKWRELPYYDGRGGRPLYVVSDGAVYDVTEFVNFHAGGDHHLRNNAGKDVTRLMRAAGMPDYVFTDVLKRFKVGKIASEDKPTS
ncbi:cytochrome b5-like [Vanessa cardui]|uniref:cytochrome b5-like n=1 Tax=Vanessa cardui TaxID=171605 RepID=UPI001F13D5E8|nr:cytochrome b5-like [Vanessa cardui]